MERRKAIQQMTHGLGALSIASCSTTKQNMIEEGNSTIRDILKGNINHSVCKWCYNMPLEQLAEAAQEIGLKSIELLNPNEWATLDRYGLQCAISNGSTLGIPRGFNDPKNHEQLQKEINAIIPKAADAGITQVICFSGNRNGMSDEIGMENCAVGLDPVVKMAQKYNVKIVMELLNSKVDHKDYMCDLTPWGASLAEKVGSEHFSLLYDIYHMQIMEGDVIATIRKYHKYISHYHTGGVPGRNEINHTQELYYPAIVEAIREIGFTGYIAQEFIPKGPIPLAALEEGVKICDV